MKLVVLFFSSLILLSCDARQSKTVQECCRESLSKAEQYSYTDPDKALHILDSVKQKNNLLFVKSKADYNPGLNAYTNLIYAISYEQKYGHFLNDSIINISCEWYKNKKDNYNICRSLLYKSIASYSKNRLDSLAFRSINQAIDIYEKSPNKDYDLGAKLYLYLGKQYRASSNTEQAIDVYKHSISLAEKCDNKNTLYSSKIELFGLYLASRNFSEALNTISILADVDTMPKFIEYNLYLSMYNYYSAKKDGEIALEYLRKVTKMDTTGLVRSINFPRIYYLMSLQYNRLGQSDSSLAYSKASVESVKDTTLPDTHFYYRTLADKYQQQGNFKDAAALYRKAHYSYIISYTRLSQKKVIELESKLNLIKLDQTIERLKTQSKIILSLSLFALTFLSLFSLNYFKKYKQNRSRLAHLKTVHDQLSQNYNAKWLESELLRHSSATITQLTDNIIQEAGKIRKISKESFENLNNLVDTTNNYTRSYLSEISNSQHFKKQYGHITELSIMTDFEKLVYILNEEGYSNNDIANFLNTSHSSIRSVKVKIQKKIQKNGFE